LRFVLSRLKCILKRNRERRCNFPRETEHEIKRGCRTAAAHSPLPFHAHPRCILAASSGFLIHAGLFFPSVALDASRRGFNDNLSGRGAKRPLPHFSLLSYSFSHVQSPIRYTPWHRRSIPSYLPVPSIKDREECPT